MQKKLVPYTLFVLFTGLALRCSSSVPSFPLNEAQDLNDPQSQPEYRLGCGDVIEIMFFKNESFSREQTIRPDGRITLQRVDDIMAAGLTPRELDRVITKAYSEFVIEPEVTVFVKEFASHKVFVFGEVKEPGEYLIDGNLRYIEAITMAGGPTEFARLSDVTLVRTTPESGRQMVTMNMRPRSKVDAVALYGFVQSRDFIYVPSTKLGSANKIMRQFYGTILPPIDVYLRALLWN